jgi:hypothetical protein
VQLLGGSELSEFFQKIYRERMAHHYEIIRTVIPEFDEKFVEQLIRKKGKLQETNEVTKIEPELLRMGGNTGNKLYRINITYKHEQDEVPASVVMKLCDTSLINSPNQRERVIERLIIYSAGLR